MGRKFKWDHATTTVTYDGNAGPTIRGEVSGGPDVQKAKEAVQDSVRAAGYQPDTTVLLNLRYDD